MRPDRARAAARRRARRRPALRAQRARRAAVGARGRRPAGRYLACPVEDDPAHALNRAWSTLQARPGTRSRTSSRSAARGRSWPARCFAAWLGVPLITLIRGNDFDAAVFSTRRRPILDDALHAQRAGDAPSRARRSSRSPRCTPATRVRWIPNGIDRADWALAPSRPRARARRGARSAATACTLGLFGQLKAKKGGVFLLDALLRSGVADRFHLLLAGWMAPDMEAWLAEHELELHGAAVPGPLRAAAVVRGVRLIAIPSFYDGLPNVLVEAAALGVPMIASRVGRDGRRADRRRDRVPVRPRRRGRAARGRCSAPRAWTTAQRERRWAPALPPTLGRDASSTRDAARSPRYVRGAARETRGAPRSRRRDPLLRARRRARAISPARARSSALELSDVVLLTASRHAARPARDRRAAGHPRPAPARPRPRRVPAPGCTHAPRRPAPDELLVDASRAASSASCAGSSCRPRG